MSASPDTACFSCDLIGKYIDLANRFTQDLSSALVVPMWDIFLVGIGLWMVIRGFLLAIGLSDIKRLGIEILHVIIAAFLLSCQGPELVNSLYTLTLTLMGGASSFIFSVASAGTHLDGLSTLSPSAATGPDAMRAMVGLARVTEEGIRKVLDATDFIFSTVSMTRWMPILYGLLLVLPWLIIMVNFSSKIVVAIFRVIMVSALSPLLMLLFAFDFGRGMFWTGLRTLFAAFMVLFCATCAVALCLYGVSSLELTGENGINFSNPSLVTAIALGWMGTALLMTGVEIANSIAGAALSNTAAGMLTAGMIGTAAVAAKPARWAGGKALRAGGEAAGKVARAGGQALGNAVSNAAKNLHERIKPTFDRSP